MVPIEALYAANQARFARQLGCTRLHDLLASHAATIPDAEAAVDGDQRLTYAALAARVDAIAKALIKGREGDFVALRTPGGNEELEIVEVKYVNLD